MSLNQNNVPADQVNVSTPLARARRRKVWADLAGNKPRSILVILSIAVGMVALGAALGSRNIITAEVNRQFIALNPPHVQLYVRPEDEDPLGADALALINTLPGVEHAEIANDLPARIQGKGGDWRNIQLTAPLNPGGKKISLLNIEQGDWPVKPNELALERASLAMLGLAVGETATLEFPSGKRYTWRISTRLHDFTRLPSQLSGAATGYISPDMLVSLNEPRLINQIDIRVVANIQTDAGQIGQLGAQAKQALEASGRTVTVLTLVDVRKHPLDGTIQAITLILSILGAAVVLLSVFLVISTITALLRQHIRQIGVMKSFGARRMQVLNLYLLIVGALGLVAVLLSLPLSVAGANGLTRLVANLLNFDVDVASFPLGILVLQAAIGLVVPILAALIPVWRGASISVKEALTDYGVKLDAYGNSWADNFLGRLRGIPTVVAMALRGGLRNKQRMVWVTLPLALATATVISIFSLSDALNVALDNVLKHRQFEVGLGLGKRYNTAQLQAVLAAVPGVAGVYPTESTLGARRVRTDGSQSDNIILSAIPADAALVSPTVSEGNWLNAATTVPNGIVVNQDFVRNERAKHSDVRVGSPIELVIESRKSNWVVIGIIHTVGLGGAGFSGAAYVDHQAYAQAMQQPVDQTNNLAVVLNDKSPKAQEQAGIALKAALNQASIAVNTLETTNQITGRNQAAFGTVITVLSVMAALIITVAAIGLIGMLSLNVIERVREIGVMRANGATGWTIRCVFGLEGLIMGLLAWVIGFAIAMPLSKVFNQAVGMALVQSPLPNTFSVAGAVIWLFGMFLLATVASWVPTTRAVRLPVREALAYQ